jgi:hypothetical protein
MESTTRLLCQNAPLYGAEGSEVRGIAQDPSGKPDHPAPDVVRGAMSVGSAREGYRGTMSG